MSKQESFPQPAERVTGIRIPDSDVAGWMKTVREMGLDDATIDRFFIRLNSAYKKQKAPVAAELTAKDIAATLERHGVHISESELASLRDQIEAGIRTSEE